VHAQLTEEQVITVLRDGGLYLTQTAMDRRARAQGEYNLLQGRWDSYETPWRTGQMSLALLEAYQVSPNPQFLHQARKAGEWWIDQRIIDRPALLGLIEATQRESIGDVLGFGNISQGTAGMFALWRTTGDSSFAQVATAAGTWLFHHTCDPATGICYDFIDPSTGLVFDQRSPFDPRNRTPTPEQVARPHPEGRMWLDMFDYTGDSTYFRVFMAGCRTLLRTQGPQGIWPAYGPNEPETGSFDLWLTLWYAEALVEAYRLTDDPSFLQSAERAVATLLKAQATDGSLYADSYLDGRVERRSVSGSAVSMLGLVMVRLAGLGRTFYAPHIHRCAQWVNDNRYAITHPDPNLRGAVVDLRQRVRRGQLEVVNRDLGTVFGLRFMAAYHGYLVQGSK
jgi:hypothetical protein